MLDILNYVVSPALLTGARPTIQIAAVSLIAGLALGLLLGQLLRG